MRENILKSTASESKQGEPPKLPQSVIDCVVGALDSAGLSPDGINKVTELPPEALPSPEASEPLPDPQERAAEDGDEAAGPQPEDTPEP